jgi:hypothetical protein
MRFRLPVLAAMSVFAVAATAHAGKGPSKAVVDQVAQFAVQADAVYQPPVGEPSPAAGSFVQAYAAPDGEEPNPARVGTYDVSTSSCSKHLTFKTVDAVEKREALVVMKTGVAASLGLPIPALSFSGGHSALAGIKYQLDEKLILDGGQEEMTKCCVENPSQCTDEIISE